MIETWIQKRNCRRGRHEWEPDYEAELYSITEQGPRGPRKYFAYKVPCRHCETYMVIEEREVKDRDHVPAEMPEPQLGPVIIRGDRASQNGEPVPYPAEEREFRRKAFRVGGM